MAPKKKPSLAESAGHIHPSAMKLLAELDKSHPGAVLDIDDEAFDVVRWETGIAEMDEALGGGAPVGHLIEIFGWEGSGKTSIGLQCLKTWMYRPENLDKLVLIVDAEHSVNRGFAVEKYGIDPTRVRILRQDGNYPAETVMELALNAASNPGFCGVMIDSLAALVPKSEGGKTLEDNDIAMARAKIIQRFCRRVFFDGAKCPVIMLNQLQDRVGHTGPGDKTKTPGGNAPKFYSSLRLRTSKIQTLKGKGDEKIGFIVEGYIKKARFSIPEKRFQFVIDFVRGIDIFNSMATRAQVFGIIEKKGAWFMLFEKKWQGKEAMLAELQADPKLFEDLKINVENAMLAAMGSTEGFVVADGEDE